MTALQRHFCALQVEEADNGVLRDIAVQGLKMRAE